MPNPLIHPPGKPAEASSAGRKNRGSRRRCWAVWLATGLGAGYLPVMPGTYGSALGVGLYLGLAALAGTLPYPRLFLSLSGVLLCGISIWVVSVALETFRQEDPSAVVLDEVAGQVLTLLPLPLLSEAGFSYWAQVAAGFVLFRALDVIKPYPIWKLGHLNGAWGVVADDIAAGLAAAVLLVGLGQLGWLP